MLTLFFLVGATLFVWHQQGLQKTLIAIMLLLFALLLLIVRIIIPAGVLVAIWSPSEASWWWFKVALWVTLNDELIYNISLVIFSTYVILKFRRNDKC
jgi:hypothetical protein